MPRPLQSRAISPATPPNSWYTCGVLPYKPTLTDIALPWHMRQSAGGAAMTFEEILDHAAAMLQRRGRLTYRTLKRQFQLDDDALNDLKDALVYAHPQVRDNAGQGLIWSSDTGAAPSAATAPAGTREPAPLAYTPPYLAEKILTS